MCEAELAGMHATSSVNNGLAASARDVCAFASIVAGRDVVEGRGTVGFGHVCFIVSS